MPLYRPPDEGPRTLRQAVTPGPIVAGGLRPALVDTSRPGNRTVEIAEQALIDKGITPRAVPMPDERKTAAVFSQGYEGIG